MVVFHHYYLQPSSAVGRFFLNYGPFGVDVFFIISGFVMYYVVSLKPGTVRDYVASRLVRIAPAYWLSTALLVTAASAFPAQFEYTGWTARTLVSSLLFVPTENPSGLGAFPTHIVGWTLNIEVFFYGLLGACLVLGKRLRFWACAALLFVLPMVWREAWPYAAVLGRHKLWEFALGLGLGHFFLHLPALRARAERSWWVPAGALCFALALLALDRSGMRILASAAIVFAALCLETRAFRVERSWVRIGRYLGTVSYSTYLLHLPWIGMQFQYFGRPDGAAAEALGLLLTSGAVLVMSHASFRTIEAAAWVRRARKTLGGG